MGDRALIATASLLSNVFRDSDIVARLGGDEFAVFACECDAAGMSVLRERVQSAVQNFNALSAEPFQLSVSLGAALYEPGKSVELEALLEMADLKMYEKKRVRARAGTGLEPTAPQHAPPNVGS